MSLFIIPSPMYLHSGEKLFSVNTVNDLITVIMPLYLTLYHNSTPNSVFFLHGVYISHSTFLIARQVKYRLRDSSFRGFSFSGQIGISRQQDSRKYNCHPHHWFLHCLNHKQTIVNFPKVYISSEHIVHNVNNYVECSHIGQ